MRCLKKIETMSTFVGLYRINGDAGKVRQLRSDTDEGRYDVLDVCKEAPLLTSLFKLFLREMDEPIISKATRDCLYDVILNNEEKRDGQAMILKIGQVLELLDPITFATLRYLLFHLKLISSVKANRMDLHNLAIVFSPNIVYAGVGGARAEQVLLYMEWNNLIVELLLDNVDLIFEK